MAIPESLFSVKSTVLADLLSECLPDEGRRAIDPSNDLAEQIRLDGGPLSFPRVVHREASELGYFQGKSFSQAIFDDSVSLDALHALKDYAKVCMSGPFPRHTPQSGELLYYATIARGITRFEAHISHQPVAKLRDVFRSMAEMPCLSPSYRELFAVALKRC